MIVLIILGVLLLLLTWLLVAPLTVKVDTWHDDYTIQWKGIGYVSLIIIENEVVVRMRIFFWATNFYPLRARKKAAKLKEKSTTKAKQNWQKFGWKRIKRILRTFQVRRFRLELDTDDYVMNAYLYPLFYLASGTKRQLSVNFEGKTNLLLHVENRLFRIIRAFVW